MLDTVLKHPDRPFYLPIGLTIANGDVVMDDAQPFAQPCKAAHKLSAVSSFSSSGLPALGSHPG